MRGALANERITNTFFQNRRNGLRGGDCELGPIANGESNLQFDLLKGKIGITLSGNAALNESDIIAAVAKTGMRAEVWKPKQSAEQTFWQRRQRDPTVINAPDWAT